MILPESAKWKGTTAIGVGVSAFGSRHQPTIQGSRLVSVSQEPKTTDFRHIKEWFILTCGHEAIYEIRPNKADVVLCIRCNKAVRIRCMQITARCRDCPYTRAFGTDLYGCRRAVTRHSFRYPDHRISIRGKKGEKLEVITGRFRNAPLL